MRKNIKDIVDYQGQIATTSASFRTGASFIALAVAGGMLALVGPESAHAFNLYDGSQSGNQLEINLTTTVAYNGIWRVNSPSAVLKPAQDGDANFQHGLVGNEISALPVLDIKDGDYGAHFSSQLYLNTSYLGTNQNDLIPYSSAIYTSKQTDFTSGTRNSDGQNAQLLDAFIYARHNFADGQNLQIKFGRSTLFWGQSLFFPTDGISGGQAPINVVSAQNLINPQAQQVFEPVGQAIVTYQPQSGTTIQGYYQFEWEHDYFQGEGAYFNSTNAIDKGAEFLGLAASGPALIGLTRVKDLDPEHQNGQFGLSFQQMIASYDLGIFVERFDAKAPEIGINPSHITAPTLINTGGGYPVALSGGNYQVVYPRDIWLQGVSFSTNIGDANVAGEFSTRERQPLFPPSGAYFILPGQNANSNPGYPIGTTWNAQLSTLYLTPPFALDPGGMTIEGEVIMNHLISVTQNRAGLATGGQATAAAFDVAFVPTYINVLPNLQVTLPVSLNYSFLGRSYVDTSLYHGNAVFDAGVTATYAVNWIASLNYQDYLGKANVVYNGLADRGFVSLNLQHTF